MMNDGDFSATSSAAIFDDCRMLSSGYSKISFVHCHREANEVAHELARHSFLNNLDCNWDDGPPNFLFAKLINDVSVINYQ